MADRNLVLQLLITAKDQASAALQSVKTGVGALGEAASQALAPLRTFGGLLTTALGIGGASELQARADAYIRLTNSLKIATSSETEYREALQSVAAIAGRTNSDIETTAQLYGKVAQSAKELGLSQKQVGQLTEVIAKGMQLSGASADTASGAIQQLTQAFGSGVLRGEEFNSVMEASPELMRQLAAGLGVTIGELRGLAEQGALTSRAVSAALLSQKDAIDKAYSETTRTVAEAFTGLNNQLILYVGKLNESTGITTAVSGTLRVLADNLNVVAAAAGAGMVAALTKGAVAFGVYVKESLAAAQASRDKAIADKAQQAAALQTAQSNLAAAQATVNRAIAEQRMAAILVQEATGEAAVARARTTAAAAAQAATAATTRYMAAQEALNIAQAATTTGSGLLSRAMGFLAGPGGLILLAVSAFSALLPLLSKNKADLDALTVSTDQYKASLEGLSEAQLLANIQKLNEGIQEQSGVVQEAEVEVNRLRDGHRNLFEVLSDGRSVTAQLTEAEGKLGDARQKLSQMQANLQVSTEALGKVRQQEDQDLGKQLAQYAQIQVVMGKYSKSLDEVGKQQESTNKANQARIQSELDLAKATGDTVAVERLTLALAKEKAVAAQQQAELDRAAAVAAGIKLEAVQAEYNLIREKQPKDEENLRLAQQDVDLKNAQATASEAAAKQISAMANGAGNLRNAQSAVFDSGIRLLEALRDEAEQSSRLAVINGNEYEARQQLVRVAEIEASLSQLNAEKKTIEADAATQILSAIQAEVEEKLKLGEIISDIDRARLKAATNAMETAAIEANAAGMVAEAAARRAAATKLAGLASREVADESAKATQGFVEQTQAAEENTRAMEDSQKATAAFSLLQKQLTEYLNGARERMDALSSSARLYFEAMLEGTLAANNIAGAQQGSLLATQAWTTATREGSDVLAEFSQKIASSSAQMGAARQDLLFAADDMRVWISAISLAEAAATKGFYEQAQSAERLRLRIHELSESGRLDIGTLTQAEQEATSGFKLLDDQDLANLRSEIEAANQKLRDMQEETEDARSRLADLNAELLEAKGEDQKAKLLRQQINYQTRLAEIEKQRREAELMGNTELVAILNQQAAVLRQINDAKVASIQTDQNAEQAGDKVARSWQGAEAAIRSTGAALGEVHNLGVKVAQIDLSGLTKGLDRATQSATLLSRTL